MATFVAPTGEVRAAAWEVAMIIHTVIRHLEKLKLENHKVKPSLGFTRKRSLKEIKKKKCDLVAEP